MPESRQFRQRMVTNKICRSEIKYFFIIRAESVIRAKRRGDGNFTYPATGKTDNQIRTLNRLGLFSPAINETRIADFSKLSPLADSSAPLESRARSYLDVNCAHCHQPRGVANFDARFDTSSIGRHIIDAPAAVTLGLVNARIVAPGDTAHSVLYQRMISSVPTAKMPPLSHNQVDKEAAQIISDWINNLPAKPAE
jgi:mono/diheme cytochrome c family protein